MDEKMAALVTDLHSSVIILLFIYRPTFTLLHLNKLACFFYSWFSHSGFSNLHKEQLESQLLSSLIEILNLKCLVLQL